ncbi:unnamed protein product [Allacma fusca]|uniref:lysozyme n=1 Tax=Allacma fusca TaxID=39272 RepID=A0A8J2LA87_9HEXA|nr:unnamed protein product [Allacma fusca]
MLFTVVALALVHFCVGKTFTPCEFALELQKLNVSRHEIGDFVCMVRHGTNVGINTRRMVVSPSGNVEMGLFKISTTYWCKDSRNFHNICNLDCEKLVDDDVEDDLACARRAMSDLNKGFRTFDSWTLNCEDRDVDKDISDCGL